MKIDLLLKQLQEQTKKYGPNTTLYEVMVRKGLIKK